MSGGTGLTLTMPNPIQIGSVLIALVGQTGTSQNGGSLAAPTLLGWTLLHADPAQRQNVYWKVTTVSGDRNINVSVANGPDCMELHGFEIGPSSVPTVALGGALDSQAAATAWTASGSAVPSSGYALFTTGQYHQQSTAFSMTGFGISGLPTGWSSLTMAGAFGGNAPPFNGVRLGAVFGPVAAGALPSIHWTSPQSFTWFDAIAYIG